MLTVPYHLEPQRSPQIGLIVLQSDETIEMDMRRLLPETVELLVSRVPSGTHVSLESLAAMAAELQRAASLFPESAQFSAIGYGCTSGSAQIGIDRVAHAVQAGAATPHVTEPVSAVIAACRAMGVQRIGLLSPYIASVSARLCETLSNADIQVQTFASFDESEEARVVRINSASIKAAAVKLAAERPVDALFISCTNLRTLDVISDIETDTGLPVFTSNQVLAWDMLRRAHVATPQQNPGVLWSKEA